MQASDQIVPHDILGLAIAALFVFLTFFIHGTVGFILTVLAIVIIIGVLVDLTAHGWDH